MKKISSSFINDISKGLDNIVILELEKISKELDLKDELFNYALQSLTQMIKNEEKDKNKKLVFGYYLMNYIDNCCFNV